MIKFCEHCRKEFPAKGIKKFCCRKCMWDARPSKKGVIKDIVCPICSKSRKLLVPSGKDFSKVVCQSCSSTRLSGENNGRWRGGHAYWSVGRFGKDKDGLSWVSQRRLAWERDSYTCQECNKQRKGWKPDVHHIIPYRISNTHNLTNLLCLCRSCHTKAELKIGI